MFDIERTVCSSTKRARKLQRTMQYRDEQNNNYIHTHTKQTLQMQMINAWIISSHLRHRSSLLSKLGVIYFAEDRSVYFRIWRTLRNLWFAHPLRDLQQRRLRLTFICEKGFCKTGSSRGAGDGADVVSKILSPEIRSDLFTSSRNRAIFVRHFSTHFHSAYRDVSCEWDTFLSILFYFAPFFAFVRAWPSSFTPSRKMCETFSRFQLSTLFSCSSISLSETLTIERMSTLYIAKYFFENKNI